MKRNMRRKSTMRGIGIDFMSIVIGVATSADVGIWMKHASNEIDVVTMLKGLTMKGAIGHRER